MTRRAEEAPATHYRLAPETRALVVEDYADGATAKEVGAKWKVAPSSVYRQAAAVGRGKRSVGDARARAHARMVEEEEAAHRALQPTGSRALKGLFSPAPVDDPEAGSPERLMHVATLASGRAMRGRLWAEAKALAGLAESYARLARAEGGAGAGRQDAEGEPDWDDAAELKTVRRKVEDMRCGSVEVALRAAAEGRDPWAAAQVPRPDWAGPEEPGEAAGDTAGDAAGEAATAAPTTW